MAAWRSEKIHSDFIHGRWALSKLRNSDNWKIGADASVAIASIGADGFIDTQITNEPVIAFVFDQKGLMYNLTLEGTKFTKLDKKG